MGTRSSLSRLASPLSPTEQTQVARRADLWQAGSFGPARNLKQPIVLDPFGIWDKTHNAFPSVTFRADGTLFAVFRSATNHTAARDGNVHQMVSMDLGRTWSLPVQSFAPAAAGTDRRDPCVSTSNDGTTLYMSYFVGTASVPGNGVYFRKSTDQGATWSSAVRVDGTILSSAASAPVVQLASGRLILPFYGYTTGQTWNSTWIAHSDDNGVTWATTRVFNGQTATQHYSEPWISRKPGADNLFMTYRVGTAANIGSSYTENADGITGWSAPAVISVGTGRPSNVWLSTGEAIVTYRNLGNVRQISRICDSPEFASGWGEPYVLRNSQGAGTGSAGLWTYGQLVEVGNGVCAGLFAEENGAATVSKVFATAVARGGGPTPLGPIPDNWSAMASGYDRLEFAFDMTGGRGTYPLVPPELSTLAGALTAFEMPGNSDINILSSANADNVPDRGYVDLGVADVDIEAEIYQSVQSGAGIIFRVVDASNFLLYTVETGGANFRLYKVVAGAATQLATVARTMPMPFWNKFRVQCHGVVMYTYHMDVLVHTYSLAVGTERDLFTSATKHGLSLNAQSGGTHGCRKFTIRSIGL